MRLALAIVLTTLFATSFSRSIAVGQNTTGAPQTRPLPDVSLECDIEHLKLLLTNPGGLRFNPDGELESVISFIAVSLRGANDRNGPAVDEIVELLRQSQAGTYERPAQREARLRQQIEQELRAVYQRELDARISQLSASRPAADPGTRPPEETAGSRWDTGNSGRGNPGMGNPSTGNPATGNPAAFNPAAGNPGQQQLSQQQGAPSSGNQDFNNRADSLIADANRGRGLFTPPANNNAAGGNNSSAGNGNFNSDFPRQTPAPVNPFPAPNNPQGTGQMLQGTTGQLNPAGGLSPLFPNATAFDNTQQNSYQGPFRPGQETPPWATGSTAGGLATGANPANPAAAGIGNAEMQRMLDEFNYMKNQVQQQQVQMQDLKLENSSLRYQQQQNMDRFARRDGIPGGSAMTPAGATFDDTLNTQNNSTGNNQSAARPRSNSAPQGAPLAVIPGVEPADLTLLEQNRRLGSQNMFLILMLLTSVGLNIYLSMIARGLYVRYGDLADELRETFTATA